ALPVDAVGAVTAIEMAPFTKNDATQAPGAMRSFLARRFFHDGCPGLSFAGSSFTLPLALLDPTPAVRYTVHFVVPDAAGNGAHGTCQVTVLHDANRPSAG